MSYNTKLKNDLIEKLEQLRVDAKEAFESSIKTPDVLKFDDYMLYQETELDAQKKLIMMDIERQPNHTVIGREAYNRLGLSKATYNNHMRPLVDEGYVINLKRGKYAMNKLF